LIRVLIADDHPVVRKGLVGSLALESGFAPPGEAGQISEVLNIRRLKRSIPVLVLSVYSDTHFVARAIKAGANGYITKSAASSEVVAAIRHLAAGNVYFAPGVAESLASSLASPGEPTRQPELTDREFVVVCRIASGKTVSEIAREISLSVKTVHIYRARALSKLGVRTNAELTRYALKSGWVV
jgi:two-component system invasion response regulator UvrY